MTDLVPADQIEQIVGARRHPLAHLGRAVSAEQTVYVLHSQQCKDSGIDLRSCGYSVALDNGIDLHDWQNHQDRTVTLQHVHGILMPDDAGPEDIEYLNATGLTLTSRACGAPVDGDEDLPCDLQAAHDGEHRSYPVADIDCWHDWTLRPESDTYVCEICGDER